ncbi:MAG: phosphoglycerate dehydrogenase [Chloroflexia bacterium]|nr:phosphoglycerate dehydrogenase [Chloroflexia bacterium]
MTAMKLAIDLDGVLTEHPRPLAHAASARFGMEMPESAFIDSAGLNVPVEVRDWVYGADGPASRLRPAPDGAEFLRQVIELLGPARVKIVTARPATAAEMTVAWLLAHDFPTCEILYADLKAATALKHGLGFAVEDSLRHARNYAAAGITCFLVNAEEAPPHTLDPSVVRVESLSHLLRLLASRSNAYPTSEDGSMTSLHPSTSGASNSAPRPTIVVSDEIHPIARARFSAAADLVDVEGTDTAALLRAVAGADALVVRSETRVSADVLAAAPKLRLVARAGVGVDNIDLPAATRSGVLVLNTPGANAVSAAEHTIALLLAVTRQLAAANESTHAGRWERKQMRPIDLRGRTVGIVGLGRVGSRVALRLRAFEMRVLAFDPYITPHRFTEFGAAPVDYQTLLANADVITFHVPATPETTHMLDAETLRLVKPEAIVINAARGEVVDQDALAAALREGRLAGAGVDVFPHEPCPSSPLFGLPNAVLTPHTGGSSAEALAAVGELISTTTLAALRGEAVPNAVNLPASSLNAPELQRLTSVCAAAGRLLGVLAPDRPERYTLTVRGLVAHDVMEHVLGTALSESLNLWTDQRVTPVNAHLVAEEVHLEVKAQADDSDQDLMPTFSFAVHDGADHHVAVRWDRTDAGITAIDGFSLEHPLAGDVLITHHRDQPGMIGQIGMIMGRYDVNIAGMQVGRHEITRGGEAIMVLNVDNEIPAAAVAEITAIDGIEATYVVSLPEALHGPVQAPLLPTLALGGARLPSLTSADRWGRGTCRAFNVD